MLLKEKVAVIALSTVLAVVIFVYASRLRLEQEFTIRILVETPIQVSAYRDPSYLEPISTIAFGPLSPPSEYTHLVQRMYIRNENNISLKIYWNSTLVSSTNQIIDWFSNDFNGTTILPAQVLESSYGITLEPYLRSENYTWTLKIWVE